MEHTEEQIQGRIDAYLRFFEQHFPCLGSGKDRIAYRVGDYVIKIPFNLDRVHSNYWEARRYQESLSWPLEHQVYAPCRMIDDLLLIMEYVTPAESGFDDLPKWTWSIDCGQVGYNSAGKLLAYDYGG